MRKLISGVSVALILGIGALGVAFGGLWQVTPERDQVDSNIDVETGQGTNVTPEPDFEHIVLHDVASISATVRTHWSDMVARVTVSSIEGPYFNTPDGLKPSGSYEDFDEADVSPFDQVDPDDTPEADWTTHADQTAEAWTANGKEVPEWDIYRLAILDVDIVYKGITSTEKLVVILPGGMITDTTTGEIYNNRHSGIDNLMQGEDTFVFLNGLAAWQVTYSEAYPIYDRCIVRADTLTSQGDEAQCMLLGASYAISGSQVSNIELPSSLQISALETEVASAMATLPAGSALVYTDSKRSNWAIPSPTPTP